MACRFDTDLTQQQIENFHAHQDLVDTLAGETCTNDQRLCASSTSILQGPCPNLLCFGRYIDRVGDFASTGLVTVKDTTKAKPPNHAPLALRASKEAHHDCPFVAPQLSLFPRIRLP